MKLLKRSYLTSLPWFIALILVLTGVEAKGSRRYTDFGKIHAIRQITDTLTRPSVIEVTAKCGKIRQPWGVIFACDTAFYTAWLVTRVTDPNTDYEQRKSLITVTHGCETLLEQPVEFHQGANTMTVEVNPSLGKVRIGEKEVGFLGDAIAGLASMGDAEVLTYVVETRDTVAKPPMVNVPASATRWVFFDRELEPDYARLGGRYVLAAVPQPSGWALVYLSGAQTNADFWKQGMVKAEMKKSLAGDYDLIWTDAMGVPISHDGSARFEGNLLIIDLPLYHARLRFIRQEQ